VVHSSRPEPNWNQDTTCAAPHADTRRAPAAPGHREGAQTDGIKCLHVLSSFQRTDPPPRHGRAVAGGAPSSTVCLRGNLTILLNDPSAVNPSRSFPAELLGKIAPVIGRAGRVLALKASGPSEGQRDKKMLRRLSRSTSSATALGHASNSLNIRAGSYSVNRRFDLGHSQNRSRSVLQSL
jgi:hypothetical protein